MHDTLFAEMLAHYAVQEFERSRCYAQIYFDDFSQEDTNLAVAYETKSAIGKSMAHFVLARPWRS